MNEFINRTEERIVKAFEEIKKQVAALFAKEQLNIVLTKNDFIPNTPLYCCLEFELNEASSNDNGLALSFSVQNYDPSKEEYEVSEKYVFIVADLATSSGSIIEDMGVRKVKSDNFEELEMVIDDVLQFVERQTGLIVDKLTQIV